MSLMNSSRRSKLHELKDGLNKDRLNGETQDQTDIAAWLKTSNGKHLTEPSSSKHEENSL